jgi:hypothetical protein
LYKTIHPQAPYACPCVRVELGDRLMDQLVPVETLVLDRPGAISEHFESMDGSFADRDAASVPSRSMRVEARRWARGGRNALRRRRSIDDGVCEVTRAHDATYAR